MSNFEAKVVADSVAPNGVRITTMTLKYPRFIHAEVMTHRAWARNYESSRAMPVKRKLELIEQEPVEPVEWGLNKAGMQASEVLSPEDAGIAAEYWHKARQECIAYARKLDSLKVHKQVVNRICEPWATITGVVTSTKWRNFDFLRIHSTADPNIQKLARLRKAAYDASVPVPLQVGDWHLPWVTKADWQDVGQYVTEKRVYEKQAVPDDVELVKRISAARCARVSLLNHEGKRPGIEEDLKLFDRLASRDNPLNDPGHFTPLEHQATPIGGFRWVQPSELRCGGCDGELGKRPIELESIHIILCTKCALGHVTSGNLHGWRQFRKEFAHEDFDA